MNGFVAKQVPNLMCMFSSCVYLIGFRLCTGQQMASAMISVHTTASRFALLQVDSDSDSDSESGRTKGGRDSGKARPGKTTGGKSTASNDKKKEKRKKKKEQQQSEANEVTGRGI